MKIVAEGVGKDFERGTRALEALSFDVTEGEFYGIVGPTGCGKTTLLNIVAGLEEPTTGMITIDSKSITGPGRNRGMLLQESGLLPWRTVMENVEFGLELKGVPRMERRKTASDYIDLVGLTGFEDNYPHELSGGMAQRTALARVLSYDPDILLMDEPFASVDALTREGLQEELLRIWNTTGKTILFVTHSIDEVVFMADRVAVLSARPGHVKEVVDIDLPRPRDHTRGTPEFAALRDHIWSLLEKEVRIPHGVQ